MKIVPEATIKAIKDKICSGLAGRKIAQDLGASKSFVNEVRNSMVGCQQIHQDRDREHH